MRAPPAAPNTSNRSVASRRSLSALAMRQHLQVDSSKDICSVAPNGASLGRARTTNGSDRGKHDLALFVRLGRAEVDMDGLLQKLAKHGELLRLLPILFRVVADVPIGQQALHEVPPLQLRFHVPPSIA